MTIQINLTPAQRQNLLAFLQLTQLSGKEVAAFNEVFSLIQQAKPEEKSEIRNPKSEPPPEN